MSMYGDVSGYIDLDLRCFDSRRNDVCLCMPMYPDTLI
jgi:hypothetical protein